MPSAELIIQFCAAIEDVGVAPVTISAAAAPAKDAKIVARPTAAGLKIFCPKPPKTSLPKKIAITVATAKA